MKRLASIILALFAFSALNAQQMPELPLDSSYKVGQLDNGLTYFIRHNDKPAQRAEFYLATHVGAAQETPDQDGLAHFLEHMCFNGTKNFPGKGIINYLESIGASFGGNVNASTGVEQTIYLLHDIPLVSEGVIDTCLLIMHDYSHFVTCDPAEIDAERGVIIEEKRTRNTASWRSYMACREYLFKGTKLGETSLIGSQENLETFKPESLTNFYHTWYRPDMQALIVVGDIDPDSVEAKIKATFADIPAAENPQQKEQYKVPDNAEPLIAIVTDPEASSTSVELFWKSEPMPFGLCNTPSGILIEACKDIISYAMNERLEAITAAPDAPFAGAGFAFMSMAECQECTYYMANALEGQVLRATEALLTEAERMKRYGFSDDEYSRAKASLLTKAENAVNKADTRKNTEFVYPCINHFFKNTPLLTPQDKLDILNQLLPMLNTTTLNQIAAQTITDENLVVFYNAPEKEGLTHPTEQQFSELIASVRASEIEALEQESIPETFLNPAKIKGGKIVKRAEGIHGSTIWTLSNGVDVVLTPKDLEKDRISVNISMDGGRTLIPTADLPSIQDDVFQLYCANCGIAGFPYSTVQKMLAGKTVSASPYINAIVHGVGASSNVKDFETALQLAYLTFTSPRFDETEYNTGMDQIKAVLPNLMSDPNYKFNNELMKTVRGNSPRTVVLDEETFAKANLKTLKKDYLKLFKGVNGARVYITGDFKPEEIEALVVKYIGALPKGKKSTVNTDNFPQFASGQVTNHFTTKMAAPKASVFKLYKNELPYSVKAEVTGDALGYILGMIYTETLREQEGGTYGASAYIVTNREPMDFALLQVYFDTNKESYEKLNALAEDGIRRIAEEGPTAEQFDKAVKNAAKSLPEQRIRNAYWGSVVRDWVRFGEDTDALTEQAVAELTPEDIKALAAHFLGSGNYTEVIMLPEE